MNTEMNTIRLIGAAQLLVFVGGVITERLLTSAVGSGSISDKLVSISNNLSLMRISTLVALIESFVIVVLAVLFYNVFNQEYKIIALVALGSFLAGAIIKAVAKIGAYALIPLSQEFVGAGALEPSYFQTLGDFFYGFDRKGYDIHMLFYCLGAILWSYMFYISRYIPRALSVWGFAAACLFLIPVLFGLYDRDFLPSAMILALPYFPYELFLGVWLIFKGFN